MAITVTIMPSHEIIRPIKKKDSIATIIPATIATIQPHTDKTNRLATIQQEIATNGKIRYKTAPNPKSPQQTDAIELSKPKIRHDPKIVIDPNKLKFNRQQISSGI